MGQENLRNGAEMELLISVEDVQAKAQLNWSETEQSLLYTAPEAVEGLCFSRSASGMEVSKDGITKKLKSGQLLRSSAAENIFSALDELLLCEGQNLTLETDFLLVKGEKTELCLGLDGSLRKILWENGSVEITG